MYDFDKNIFLMGDHGSCGCGCGCGDEHCHEHAEEEMNLVTMIEETTGTEYQFQIVDDFDFEGEVYCVLLTLDKEDPEALIVKVVTDENGEDFFMSLEEEEYDRVAQEYEKILDETEEEDEENEEEA